MQFNSVPYDVYGRIADHLSPENAVHLALASKNAHKKVLREYLLRRKAYELSPARKAETTGIDLDRLVHDAREIRHVIDQHMKDQGPLMHTHRYYLSPSNHVSFERNYVYVYHKGMYDILLGRIKARIMVIQTARGVVYKASIDPVFDDSPKTRGLRKYSVIPAAHALELAGFKIGYQSAYRHGQTSGPQLPPRPPSPPPPPPRSNAERKRAASTIQNFWAKRRR